MQITRLFTKSHSDPYHGIAFVTRRTNAHSGEDQARDIIVPSTWSQHAVDVLGNKYMRKTGVPQPDGTLGGETDARQVFRRLAECWTVWGLRYDYFSSVEDGRAFSDEMQYMLCHQMGAPNSPQWFNTGLHHSYGIEGEPQGLWRYNPESKCTEELPHSYVHSPASACFIQSVEDDLVNDGGIMDLWRREARLFKYGSGSGSNFSKLRARHERLSGGGRSSGLMSWLKIGDSAAGAIKSGGTTRRAAKMVILNIDHPDIEEFINLKVKEEQKVAALVVGSQLIADRLNRIMKRAWVEQATGHVLDIDPQSNTLLAEALIDARANKVPELYIQRALSVAQTHHRSFTFSIFDFHWEGEAYQSVTGQNANNSVRISNAFLDCLATDGLWALRNRTDGAIAKEIPARALWDQICSAAWHCADPGIQYDDIINDWHTTPAQGRIHASNPCSEYLSNDDTACNLGSLNLLKFLKPDGLIDHEAYTHAVRLWTIALDITVTMASYPSQRIAERSATLRQLGLGYANLGAVLMQLGLAYDSQEGRALAQVLTSLMTGTAYRTSAELAKELGPFHHFAENRASMLRVISNHLHATNGVDQYDGYEGLSVIPQAMDLQHVPPYLGERARQCWEETFAAGSTDGFRNAQVTVIAPTGTIGIVMDCDTTGIEPDFALVKDKSLAGGGRMKLVNQSVAPALQRLGYRSHEIDDILHHILGHRTFQGCPSISPERLQALGLSVATIDRLHAQCHHRMNLTSLLAPEVVGVDWCMKKFQLSEADVLNQGFRLAERLGFNPTEIATAEYYIFGRMTIEGAPHLKDEHLPVFDCANTCGPYSHRSILPRAHVQMIGAVQPFVSGGISKSVNLPATASIQHIDDIYRFAYSLGVKCLAVYRDGSKLSQPLTAMGASQLANALSQRDIPSIAEELAAQTLADTRGVHRPLPNKRNGYTQKATIGGHTIYLRTGEYEDGTLGEIFLDMHKEGAAFRSLMNCYAIALSLGLQYGVPLEEFVEAFTFMRFEPNGAVNGHDTIKMCSSLMDYIMRDLAVHYLDRQDLAHVRITQEDLRADSVKPYTKDRVNGKGTYLPPGDQVSGQHQPNNPIQDARLKGYEGDACPECHQFTMVRNGTCLKCVSCGSTSGCS